MNINKLINYKEYNQALNMEWINGSIVFTKDKTIGAMNQSLEYRYKRLVKIDRLNGYEWCFECQKNHPRTNKAGEFKLKYKGIL